MKQVEKQQRKKFSKLSSRIPRDLLLNGQNFLISSLWTISFEIEDQELKLFYPCSLVLFRLKESVIWDFMERFTGFLDKLTCFPNTKCSNKLAYFFLPPFLPYIALISVFCLTDGVARIILPGLYSTGPSFFTRQLEQFSVCIEQIEFVLRRIVVRIN